MSRFEGAGEHLAIALSGGCALFTTRRGGVSEGPYASLNLGPWTDDDRERVAENRRRVAALAGDAQLAQGHQVHGTHVERVTTAAPVRPADADGQATAARGIAPIVLVADCLPVALIAPGAVAMIHAGWRGLAGGVLENGVGAVRALAPGASMAAAIGPGIGPCCYEVGAEVHAALGTAGRTADLKAVAARRLRAAGVDEVHDCGLCTACDPGRFFSHRRDNGATGRQAGIAWLS